MLAVTRSALERMIPHAGPMCLLDGVVSWDAESIRCVSSTHRDPHNPLRSRGTLHVLCGIEYAAQAMAVHGGLACAPASKPKSGFLVSVREVACRVGRLDDLDGELIVDAQRVMGDASRVIYGFRLSIGAAEVLSGRATVVLDAL